MNDKWQDADLVKSDQRRQARLEGERLPWESTWREIDERYPDGAGGFIQTTQGQVRGAFNYDSTHILSLARFAAAGVAITTPEEVDYIRPRFADENLMKIRSVQLWCENAGKRLYDIRHASRTGFGVSAHEDWDQLGRYGTSAVWQEAKTYGLCYRTLHLSETWIDVDVTGTVNTVHRKFCRTVRQIAEQIHKDDMTPKMLDALKKPGGEDTEFEILHVVIPNTEYDQDTFDYRRFPVASRYLALDEKLYVKRAGYYTQPITVSRHMTSAGEKYGRSPAIQTMPNVQGLSAMKLTSLRSAHKAVDPALIFNDDNGATKLVTRPGGLNPGFVNDAGQPTVHRMPGGEQGIPLAMEMIEDDRAVVRSAFLEDFYKILTDPNSRMTTTEVLEVMSKQGVIVRPFASRYATEKQQPMTARDLDLALRAKQIEPFPPEVKEAGAWPVIDYENPLAAMARAESSSKTLRWLQAMPILAQIDPKVAARVNADAIAIGLAVEMGVKPSYVRTDQEVAKLTQDAQDAQEQQANVEQLATSAGAVKDLAQANQLAEAT
jgi:hypothetical protein